MFTSPLQDNKKNFFIKLFTSVFQCFTIFFTVLPLADSRCKKYKPLDIDGLRLALNKIARLNPLLKGEFIQSCIEIVNNDGEITQHEYELLRILGEYLDSPLPISPQ